MFIAKSPEYQGQVTETSEDQKVEPKPLEPRTSFVLEAKEMCRKAVREKNLTLEEKNVKLKYICKVYVLECDYVCTVGKLRLR